MGSWHGTTSTLVALGWSKEGESANNQYLRNSWLWTAIIKVHWRHPSTAAWHDWPGPEGPNCPVLMRSSICWSSVCHGFWLLGTTGKHLLLCPQPVSCQVPSSPNAKPVKAFFLPAIGAEASVGPQTTTASKTRERASSWKNTCSSFHCWDGNERKSLESWKHQTQFSPPTFRLFLQIRSRQIL